MNQSKSQFYATWIIFGLASYYGFRETLELLCNLIISAEIYLNVNSTIAKFSKLFIYIIVLIILIFISLRIIKSKSQTISVFNARSLRKWIVILVFSGLISQIASQFLSRYSFKLFDQYADKQSLNMLDYYPDYLFWTGIPNTLLFIYAVILFFILTKDKENKN